MTNEYNDTDKQEITGFLYINLKDNRTGTITTMYNICLIKKSLKIPKEFSDALHLRADNTVQNEKNKMINNDI
jgi:hypothetical protein